MNRSLIAFGWVLVTGISVIFAYCPSSKELQPCSCYTKYTEKGEEVSTIVCSELTSEDEVAKVMLAAAGKNIFGFTLVDSYLRFLPSDAFKNTNFNVITIVNSSLLSLSDTNVAFEGLEQKLHILEIVNCSFVSDWDWRQLKHLQKLIELDVSHSDLLYITEYIEEIEHLNLDLLNFRGNNIMWLDDKAFSFFENLKSLYLDNNLVENLKRSMFPTPTAASLEILGLSHNMMTSLPADVFTNMPVLRSLYLSGNLIHTLDQRVFSPIWDNLKIFFFEVPLNCDCRLMWVTKTDMQKKFIKSTCAAPSQLKGKPIDQLKPKDLWC